MTVRVVVVTLAMMLTVNAPVIIVVLMVKYNTRNGDGRSRNT